MNNGILEGYKALTGAEADHQLELNHKNGWGFSIMMLKRLGTEHRKAYERGDILRQEAIAYRLTDANFHTERRLLSRHDYKTYFEEVEA